MQRKDLALRFSFLTPKDTPNAQVFELLGRMPNSDGITDVEIVRETNVRDEGGGVVFALFAACDAVQEWYDTCRAAVSSIGWEAQDLFFVEKESGYGDWLDNLQQDVVQLDERWEDNEPTVDQVVDALLAGTVELQEPEEW